jgi:tetratricopeptide (TPR) repeat protein
VLARTANVLANLGENLDGVLDLVDRSTALDPGSACGWFVSARSRVMVGDPDLAVQHMEMSMRLDPLSHFRRGHQLSNLALARFQQGRFGKAIGLFQASPRLLPKAPIVQAAIASALGHLGQTEAARQSMARYSEMTTAPIEDSLGFFRHPDHRRLLLDGIALIESPRALRIVTTG